MPQHITRHLAFRDFLRTDEYSRETYGRLKRELALRFPYDIDSYCDGKDELVKEIEKKAMQKYAYGRDGLYIAAHGVQRN